MGSLLVGFAQKRIGMASLRRAKAHKVFAAQRRKVERRQCFSLKAVAHTVAFGAAEIAHHEGVAPRRAAPDIDRPCRDARFVLIQNLWTAGAAIRLALRFGKTYACLIAPDAHVTRFHKMLALCGGLKRLQGFKREAPTVEVATAATADMQVSSRLAD